MVGARTLIWFWLKELVHTEASTQIPGAHCRTQGDTLCTKPDLILAVTSGGMAQGGLRQSENPPASNYDYNSGMCCVHWPAFARFPSVLFQIQIRKCITFLQWAEQFLTGGVGNTLPYRSLLKSVLLCDLFRYVCCYLWVQMFPHSTESAVLTPISDLCCLSV